MKLVKMTILLLALCLCSYSYSNVYIPKFEGHFREYETHPLDLIARFLPNNPYIFEAGAHYGDDTVRFIQKWPNSTIYSFEPNPHAYGMLIDRVKDYFNVNSQNIAIADHNGTATFYVCYGSFGNEPIYEGASSLLPPSDFMKQHYQGPRIEVDCVILDDWCRANNVKGFDFMWMDMEGYELQALSSSPEILSTVKAIFVETNFQNFRIGMTQYADLRTFLENNGFQLLSHWYAEGYQGNAIFVRNELYPF